MSEKRKTFKAHEPKRKSKEKLKNPCIDSNQWEIIDGKLVKKDK